MVSKCLPREESLESGSDRIGDSRDLGYRAAVLALTNLIKEIDYATTAPGPR